MKKIIFASLVGLALTSALVYAGPFGFFNRGAANCANGNCATQTVTLPAQKVVAESSLLGETVPAKVVADKVNNDCLGEVCKAAPTKVEKKLEKKVVVTQKVAYNTSMRTSNQFKNNRPVLYRTGRILSRLRFWR